MKKEALVVKKSVRVVKKRKFKSVMDRGDEDAAVAHKSKKKKVAEIINSQWSNEELKHFYLAFRKYGKKWEKIAKRIRTKSAETVASLYNLNRAYLSLPEGQATVDGLIAATADYYNNLDESDSDHKSNYKCIKTCKPPGYARAKVQVATSKGSDKPQITNLQKQSAPSSYKYKLVKNNLADLFGGMWPRVTGKRTPRVPVSYNQVDGNTIVSPDKRNSRAQTGVAPDEGATLAALALVEASRLEGSPEVSQTSGRTVLTRSYPVENVKDKDAKREMANLDLIDDGLEDDCLKGTSRKLEADSGVFSTDTKLLDVDESDQSKTLQKPKIFKGKRTICPGTKYYQSDDVLCVSNGKKKQRNVRNFVEIVSEPKTAEVSQLPRKRSNQFLLEDENSAIEALQLLANLSSNTGLLASGLKSEPAFVNERRTKDGTCDTSNVSGLMPSIPESDKYRNSVQADTGHALIDAHKSSVPEPIIANPESGISKIALTDDRRYSPIASNKVNVPVLMSDKPGGDTSKILVQGDRGVSPFIGIDSVNLKQSNLGKDISTEGHAFSGAVRGHIASVSEILERKQKPLSDIDYMQPHCSKNMLGDLRKQNGVADKFYDSYSDRILDSLLKREVADSTKLAKPLEELHKPVRSNICKEVNPNESLDVVIKALDSSQCMPMRQSKGDTVYATLQAKAAANEEAAEQHANFSQPCLLELAQARDSDIKAIFELSCALDKKEALLKELRDTNDVLEKHKTGELSDISGHVEHYNMVFKLLNDASSQVDSALGNLRQRNTYNKNSTPPCFRSTNNSAGPCGPHLSNAENLINPDSGSHIMETVAGSRKQARIMVDVALLAMTSLKEGEDAHTKIGEILDSADHCQAVSSMRKPARTVNVPKPGVPISSANGAESPSELISACVATFLLIQTISERRYPPSEVVGMLDHAIKGLRPNCSQNLPIYRDIERCIGIIKTQMLALVATPRTSLPSKISV